MSQRPFYTSRNADSPYDEFWCDDRGHPIAEEREPEVAAQPTEEEDADVLMARLRESLAKKRAA